MQITFNTNGDFEGEAIALIKLLVSMYPDITQATNAIHSEAAAALSASQGVTYTAGTEFKAPPVRAAELVTVTVGSPIAADDNPATGTATASEVFTQGVEQPPVMTDLAGGVSYADHIAKGWTDALLVEHKLMLPRVAPVVAAGDAAAVFGGTPAPLAVTNGATPAPSSTAATAPPPPSDAASVFAAASATPAQQPGNASDAAGTTLLAPSGELDKDGLPWDGRIHAATRTKTAKDVWKKKKGVDDATIAAVTAELRAVQAANKAAEHKPLNTAPPPPAAVNAAPPPPAAAAGVAPPPPSGPVTFVEVAKYVGERKFTAEQILTVCKKHGLPGLGLLTGAPALCAPIMADFQAL